MFPERRPSKDKKQFFVWYFHSDEGRKSYTNFTLEKINNFLLDLWRTFLRFLCNPFWFNFSWFSSLNIFAHIHCPKQKFPIYQVSKAPDLHEYSWSWEWKGQKLKIIIHIIYEGILWKGPLRRMSAIFEEKNLKIFFLYEFVL